MQSSHQISHTSAFQFTLPAELNIKSALLLHCRSSSQFFRDHDDDDDEDDYYYNQSREQKWQSELRQRREEERTQRRREKVSTVHPVSKPQQC